MDHRDSKPRSTGGYRSGSLSPTPCLEGKGCLQTLIPSPCSRPFLGPKTYIYRDPRSPLAQSRILDVRRHPRGLDGHRQSTGDALYKCKSAGIGKDLPWIIVRDVICTFPSHGSNSGARGGPCPWSGGRPDEVSRRPDASDGRVHNKDSAAARWRRSLNGSDSSSGGSQQ